MPGDLHEVSRAIGGLESSVKALQAAQDRGNELFDQHCHDDDARHVENVTEIRGLRGDIGDLRAAIERLAQSIATMQPIVDGYQLTRSKIAAWASMGLGVLVIVGWIVEAGVKWLVALILSHWN